MIAFLFSSKPGQQLSTECVGNPVSNVSSSTPTDERQRFKRCRWSFFCSFFLFLTKFATVLDIQNCHTSSDMFGLC